MRRFMLLFAAMLALTLGLARAESPADALGLAGSGENSVHGAQAARTSADIFQVMQDGDMQALVRVPREGGEPFNVERAKGISQLVPIGGTLYYLRENEDGAVELMRRSENTIRTSIYTFPAGTKVSSLCAFDENLYLLMDNQLHVVYPQTGMCLKLVSAQMSEYVIVGEYVYYISLSDTMTYQTNSLLGDSTLEASAGCLYRLNLSTANSTLLIKTGVEDLKYGDSCLYFHNLSDNYVMGTEDSEWMEGRLYRFSLEDEELHRVSDGYDWGFYPLPGGVAVYTSEALTFYPADSELIRVLAEPAAQTVISPSEDALILYVPDAENPTLTLLYADGTSVNALEGEPGFLPASAGGDASLGDGLTSLEGDETLTGGLFANAGGSGEGENSTGGSATGSSLTSSSGGTPSSDPIDDWFEAVGSSSTGSSSTESSASPSNSSTASSGSASTSSSSSSSGSKTGDTSVSAYTVKATSSTNLRKGPGLSYAKVGTLAQGKSLSYRGVSRFDSRGVAWHKVSYNGGTAWVSWKYANLQKNGSAISESQCVKATASVNLRTGPGTNYTKRTSVSKGTQLVYLGESQSSGGVKWYKVSCDKGVAWVTSQYAKLVKPAATSSSSSGSSSGSSESSAGAGSTIVTTASVNLRKGPGLGYAAITSVSKGKSFSCLGSATDNRGVKWYKVSYNGASAWISSKYSKIGSSSGSSSGSGGESGSTVTTTGSVNLRSGPGLNYDSVSTASAGKSFSYISSATDERGVKWYKVSYSGGTAWISSKYSKLS